MLLIRYGTACLLGASLFVASPCSAEMPYLEGSEPITRSLEGQKAHRYLLRLEAGRFVHVRVEQQGVDVRVSLRDPAGVLLAESDFPDRDPENGFEHLRAITTSAGAYELEVRSPREYVGGRYRLELVKVRLAEPEDGPFIVAEREYTNGLLARMRGSRAALGEAAEHYRRSVELWQKAGNARGEAKTRHNLGGVYRALKNPDRASEQYEFALPLWREAGDVAGEIDTLLALARIVRDRGEIDRAIRLLEKARALAPSIDDPLRFGRLLNSLGFTLRLKGELDRALETYVEALGHRRGRDRFGEAETLINLGVVENRLAEFQSALEHFHEARGILGEDGPDSLRAAALNSLGSIYSVLGQNQDALIYFAEANELNVRRALPRQEARTWIQIGRARHFLEQREEALDAFDHARRLLQTIDDPVAEARLDTNLGRTLAALGRTPEALAAFERALDRKRRLGSRRDEATTLAEMAALYEKRGELEKAVEHGESALELARDMRSQVVEVYALRGLASVDRRRGKLGAARRRTEDAIAIVESLRRAAVGYEHRAAFLARKRSYYEFWIDLLMDLHRQHPEAGHDAAALIASERARARSLVDMLSEAQIELGGVPPELGRRELAWRRRLDALERRRLGALDAGATAVELRELENELATAVESYRTVQAQIRAASPRSARLTEPRFPDLRDLRRQLDDDTLLLEFFLGEKRSFVWTVTPSSIRGYELPPGPRIERRIRAVMEHLTARARWIEGETLASRQRRIRRADRELTAAAADLSRTLLAPVAAELDRRRLVIVPEGALEYLPFAVLPRPGTDPPAPLVTKHEIVSIPSVSALLALRDDVRGRAPAKTTLLVIADPVFDPLDPRVDDPPTAAAARSPGDYRRLLYSAREAESIATLLPASEALVATGFVASRSFLDRSELRDFRIVHFATHGRVHSQHPELSALVLSMVDRDGQPVDGHLRLHDIYDLELRSDLVVLSACQTALGPQIRGEGLVGLTRGFFYAGSARVLASLWTVEDRATKELMVRFYQRLLQSGEAPSEALRQAQLSMWRESRFAAPYFWAGFVLQGEWR